MASATIYDLTQETSLNAADRLIVQQTGASTRATSATFGLLGGLEHNAQTPTSSDITGAAGQLYLITQSSQSATINLTLPASANVGERIGVHMVDGDDTYAVILKGAATVTINGGSAATEWSRLFIAGETVVFRCTSSTNWIVEYDGRIPCKCIYNGDATVTSAAGWTASDLSALTEGSNVGDCADTTTDQIGIRRAGTWFLSATTSSDFVIDTDEHVGARWQIDTGGGFGSLKTYNEFGVSPNTNLPAAAAQVIGAVVAVGDALQAQTKQNAETSTTLSLGVFAVEFI